MQRQHMTNPIAPPAAPVVPQYPQLGSPNFNQEAYDYATAMPAVTAGIAALAENAHANAGSSKFHAEASATSALNAGNAATRALASANFKGMWSSLPSGSFPAFASVKHNGRLWISLVNITNVTASVPSDANAQWTSLYTGADLVQPVSSSTNLVEYGSYRLLLAVDLTLPANPTDGATIDIVNSSSASTSRILRNGKSINGLSEDLTIDLPYCRFQLNYSNSYGWYTV